MYRIEIEENKFIKNLEQINVLKYKQLYQRVGTAAFCKCEMKKEMERQMEGDLQPCHSQKHVELMSEYSELRKI